MVRYRLAMWGLIFPVVCGAQIKNTNLEDFFRFNQELSKAVCDDALISKAPTISATTETPAANLADGAYREFYLKLQLGESELISFLLEDPRILVVAPSMRGLWRQARKKVTARKTGALRAALIQFKKRVSLEICTALVTPGNLALLRERKPSLFLPLYESRPKVGRGESLFLLRDVENRFGRLQGKWYLTGWMEPYEVAWVQSGIRRYRRLANPITNQMRFVNVSAADGIPLGYLVPAQGNETNDWVSLKKRATEEAAVEKRIQMYRLLVENAAYRALHRSPQSVDAIRKLQEFYKSLLNAYRLYPTDDRFKTYARSPLKLRPQKILPSSFFSMLSGARLNQTGIALSYFAPDPKLHGIFKEYESRLSQAAR